MTVRRNLVLASFAAAAVAGLSACSSDAAKGPPSDAEEVRRSLRDASVVVGYATSSSEYLDDFGGQRGAGCLRFVLDRDGAVHLIGPTLEEIRVVGQGAVRRPTKEVLDAGPSDLSPELAERSRQWSGGLNDTAPDELGMDDPVELIEQALSEDGDQQRADDDPPPTVDVRLAPPGGAWAVIRTTIQTGENPPVQTRTTTVITDLLDEVAIVLPEQGSTTASPSSRLIPSGCDEVEG